MARIWTYACCLYYPGSRTPLKSKTNTIAPPHGSPAPHKAVPLFPKGIAKKGRNDAPVRLARSDLSTAAPSCESPRPRTVARGLIDPGVENSFFSSSLKQDTLLRRRQITNLTLIRDQLSTPKQDTAARLEPQISQSFHPMPNRRPSPPSNIRPFISVNLRPRISPIKAPISPATRRRRLQQRHEYFDRVQAYQCGQPRTFIHTPATWDDWIPAETVPEFQEIENLVVPELSALGRLSDGDVRFYYSRARRARQMRKKERKPYRRCVRATGMNPFALRSKGVRILQERRMYTTGVPYQT